MSGRPGINSCSFANATMLPAKLSEPMMQLTMIAHVMYGCAVPFATAVRKSCAAISAAEPPPMPLKSATICGIAVMRTRRAETAPMTVPMMIGGMISGQLPVLWIERRGDAEHEEHADCGNAIALPRGRRRAQQLDAEHEGDGGHQVTEGGERGRLHGGQ